MSSRVGRYLLVGLLACAASASAQTPPSGPPLELLGMAPGVSRGVLQDQIAKLSGNLACKSSTVDHRFSECTGTVRPDRHAWSVLASVVNDTVGIILLTAPLDDREIGRLRERLTETLGRPNLRKQANQESFEWIRAGRMMRLTSRVEAGRIKMSVSLIEGRVLDDLSKAD